MSQLIGRYFSAENTYHTKHEVDSEGGYSYSLFNSQSSELKTIIQATIYGDDYAKKHTYSEKDAKKYRKKHDVVDYDDFADDVLDNYKAVKGNGHQVEG